MSSVAHPCIKCDAASVKQLTGWRGRQVVQEVRDRWPEKVAIAGDELLPCVCTHCGKTFVVGVERDDLPRPRPSVTKRKNHDAPTGRNRHHRRAVGQHARKRAKA